jgi:hypothetical protein
VLAAVARQALEKATMGRRRLLDIRKILRWAEMHRERTGRWPKKYSGTVFEEPGEKWSAVDAALRTGRRGLPGGFSLAQLLAREKGARNHLDLPRLTEDQILAWADAHHRQTGAWPTAKSGIIPDSGREKWSAVDTALLAGLRGLPGGSSLARLLARHRGFRNIKDLPPFTEDQILAWADAHHRQTGDWPTERSGPVLSAPGETWMAVTMALSYGRRGLPGGITLPQLLADKRDVRKAKRRPHLTPAQILAWADAHHGAPGENWRAVNLAMLRGMRGLSAGLSLALLLERERGVRPLFGVPLRRKEILAWATAHHRRTGQWPTRESGPIPEAPGEAWSTVDTALRNGLRGLRGGSSLPRLLAACGKKRNIQDLPPLTKREMLAWADAHHERSGHWPNGKSGPVVDAPDERWDLIDVALRVGLRGQPGGSSLARLLFRKRGVRNPKGLPPLTREQVLAWAERHRQRTGKWPQQSSGLIADAPGETWAGVDNALRCGRRGLPAGSSLARLFPQEREQDLAAAG